MATLYVGLFFLALSLPTCCSESDNSEFCIVFSMLSPMEQGEVTNLLGHSCDGDVQGALKKMEKRNPNFLRFGRSQSGDAQLRLSRSNGPNFLRFGRSDPNFLRFGKAAADPNFLRFGKRASGEPNFLRFGRQSSFDREARQPNFLRFGRK
ncbi:flp-1 [Pristionchus pacificus]|uniref:Flp-1 n=1 Tax=Pristionchus pacificus TaxID=54126 RepID=A0A2A6BYJ9_PRIPA|nr:flp-1 [Pristionchus pacificus]|eukprot:PDM70995.1 flp-1 [Pristionchus pacificus]